MCVGGGLLGSDIVAFHAPPPPPHPLPPRQTFLDGADSCARDRRDGVACAVSDVSALQYVWYTVGGFGIGDTGRVAITATFEV